MAARSFKVIMEIVGVSQSLATGTFNNAIICTVLTPCDEFVCLTRSEADWAKECKGFIENCEFPCAGPWNGFHVHIGWRLKNYFSFKNKYAITSMDLIDYI